MNLRENFASWINKIRVRECATEWLEWQTYNVANAEYPVYLDTRRSTKAAHWQLARWGERGQFSLFASGYAPGGLYCQGLTNKAIFHSKMTVNDKFCC